MNEFKVGDLVVRKEGTYTQGFIRLNGGKFGVITSINSGYLIGFGVIKNNEDELFWNSKYFDLVESDIGL